MSETPTSDPIAPTDNAPQAQEPVVVAQEPGGSMTSTGESIVENDLTDEEFEAALEGTVTAMEDGKIIEGVVVKVDPDEVLLDIGWKSEGVIPSRELSIKLDVDPNEIVAVGDVVEALVMKKEDEEGRLVLSKKRAQYERAWGTIEQIYTERQDGAGHGHRGGQGWPHPRHRAARLPARLPGRDAACPRPPALRRRDARVQDHRARQEPQQRRALPPEVPRGDPVRVPQRVPDLAAEGRDPRRGRVLHRQLRCVRGPRRCRRPGARLRAVLEAHRPPVRGRRGGRRGRGRGPGRGPRARAGVAVAQGHPGGPVAEVRPRARGRASSSTAR
jgi:predicted RNA-binding protein with RPS1 domain